MSGADFVESAPAPTAVPLEKIDGYAVDGQLTEVGTALGALACEDARLQDQIEAATARRAEIAAEVKATLLAFPAPKSIVVGAVLRITQTEPSKPRETFDKDVARRLFEQKGVALLIVNDVFAGATKKGKPGEGGLQMVRIKKAEESQL